MGHYAKIDSARIPRLAAAPRNFGFGVPKAGPRLLRGANPLYEDKNHTTGRSFARRGLLLVRPGFCPDRDNGNDDNGNDNDVNNNVDDGNDDDDDNTVNNDSDNDGDDNDNINNIISSRSISSNGRSNGVHENLPKTLPLFICTGTYIDDTYRRDEELGYESVGLVKKTYNGVTKTKNLETKILASYPGNN